MQKNVFLWVTLTQIFLLKLGDPNFLGFSLSIFEIEYFNILTKYYDEIHLLDKVQNFSIFFT